MSNLTEGENFEKARRWALVAGIGAIALLVLITVLEAWGAIDFYEQGSEDDWGYYYGGESTIWGNLQNSLGIIAGFSFAVIVMVLFVVPREKKD